jgi:hypothetical protein
MTAHTLTFRVTREETLDTRTVVWGADPVDAPISTGVTGRTLTELHEEAEAAAWFILDVPKDTKIDVRYVYDFDEQVAADLDAYRRMQEQERELIAERERVAIRIAQRLTAAGISERDGALVMGVSKQKVHQLKHAS